MNNILRQYEEIQRVVDENKKYIGKEVVNISFSGDGYGLCRGKIYFYKSLVTDISYDCTLKYSISHCNSNKKWGIFLNDVNKKLYLSKDSFKKLLNRLLIDKETIDIGNCCGECYLLSIKNISRKKLILDSFNNLNNNSTLLRLVDDNSKGLQLYCVELEKVRHNGIVFNDGSIVSNPNELLESGYYTLNDIDTLINDIIKKLYDDCDTVKNSLNEGSNLKLNKDDSVNTNDINKKIDKLIEEKIKNLMLSDEFIDKVSKNILSIIKNKL